MDAPDSTKITILFSQAHGEKLAVAEGADGEPQFSLLRQKLAAWGYVTDHTNEVLSSERLQAAHILVVGAPRKDFEREEIEAIERFLAAGGGLLLINDAETMINPPFDLNLRMAEVTGLQFREYLNYPPTFLQVFWPHYITANVRRVQVGKVASLAVSNQGRPLALTKATRQRIMACSSVGPARVVAVGDVGWFTDDLLAVEDNEQLLANTFCWLAARNVIEVEEVTIPETVRWGQAATIVLQLRNSDPEVRPQVECVLESDADALISEPVRKSRSLPPGKTTRMQWVVHPQTLGEQKLRLAVHVNEHTALFFDQLPEMHCLAPGYFTLEIRGDKSGQLQTDFQTGEYLTVEGVFHWAAESEPLPHRLELALGDGLVERGCERGDGVNRWHLQAAAAGSQALTLRIAETGQSLPALVTVHPSYSDRLAEIQAAYVYPLEAEIVERLRMVDERLSDVRIQGQPFRILPPEEFVQAVYKREAVSWLQGVLAAAHREQWYNPDLLDLVLTNIAPTYLPGHGAFVPCDPGLASSLATLHPAAAKSLEYNLLCCEESEDINVKQNVAAFLLHEKYGHGFFYVQTRLGQQLAILQGHGFPDEPDRRYEMYEEAVRVLEDSALIVNEGFAAWMELAFLGKLDREVRQALYPRQMLLIQQAGGLSGRRQRSAFFSVFSPRYDSRYREGFEYLDFVGQRFGQRCAVQVFLIATCIDFGITEDVEDRLHFKHAPAEIERLLLELEEPDWRSHLRLRKITDLLYERDDEVEALIKGFHCPTDCRSDGCPLERYIFEKLNWRIS